MPNLIWEWNQTDASQFTLGKSIWDGRANTSTGSVDIDSTSYLGDPALRFTVNPVDGIWQTGRIFYINDIESLPNRYTIVFTLVTSSAYPAGTNSVYGIIVPFYNEVRCDGHLLRLGGAGGVSQTLVFGSASSNTGAGGTTHTDLHYRTGGQQYFIQVNHRPENHVSGSFSINYNWFANGVNASNNRDHDSGNEFGASAGQGNSVSGGLANTNCNRVGIGIYNSVGSFRSGSFTLKDFRIYAHPDEITV